MDKNLYELRNALSEGVNDYWESITTSAASDASGLVDASLQDESEENDFHKRKWFMMHSGLEEGSIRRSNDSTGSTGAVVMSRNWDNTIQADETYSMHEYDPRLKNRAIREAIKTASADIKEIAVDDSIVVDNIIPNPVLDVVDTGLRFDGTDDYVTVTDAASIQNIFSSGATVEARVRIISDGDNSVGRIISKENGWSLYTLDEVSGESCAISFVREHATTDGEWATFPQACPIDEPVWISVTYDEGALTNDSQLYINGIRQRVNATVPSGAAADDASDDLKVGAYGAIEDWFFDGIIYEIRIWDHVRTQAQIRNNLDSQLNGNESGLIALYSLDRNTGTTMVDNAINTPSLDGTITSAVWTDDIAKWVLGGTIGILSTSTQHLFDGNPSIELTAPAGGASDLRRELFDEIDITEVSGKSITFRCLVWASAASTARLLIEFTSESATSDYHSGENEWQLLELTAAYPSAATTMQLKLIVEASGTAYFALPHASIGDIYKYPISVDFINRPHQVMIQTSDDPNSEFQRVDYIGLTKGRRLKLIGRKEFDIPQLDSDSININNAQESAIILLAQSKFWQILADTTESDLERERLLQKSADNRLEYERMLPKIKDRMSAHRTEMWNVLDGELVFSSRGTVTTI